MKVSVIALRLFIVALWASCKVVEVSLLAVRTVWSALADCVAVRTMDLSKIAKCLVRSVGTNEVNWNYLHENSSFFFFFRNGFFFAKCPSATMYSIEIDVLESSS